jgi:hypothetical protein
VVEAVELSDASVFLMWVTAAVAGDPVRLGSVAGDGYGSDGARRQGTAAGCCWLGAAVRCLHRCGLHGPNLG